MRHRIGRAAGGSVLAASISLLGAATAASQMRFRIPFSLTRKDPRCSADPLISAAPPAAFLRPGGVASPIRKIPVYGPPRPAGRVIL